jgi:hypothetical protein
MNVSREYLQPKNTGTFGKFFVVCTTDKIPCGTPVKEKKKL